MVEVRLGLKMGISYMIIRVITRSSLFKMVSILDLILNMMWMMDIMQIGGIQDRWIVRKEMDSLQIFITDKRSFYWLRWIFFLLMIGIVFLLISQYIFIFQFKSRFLIQIIIFILLRCRLNWIMRCQRNFWRLIRI